MFRQFIFRKIVKIGGFETGTLCMCSRNTTTAASAALGILRAILLQHIWKAVRNDEWRHAILKILDKKTALRCVDVTKPNHIGRRKRLWYDKGTGTDSLAI